MPRACRYGPALAGWWACRPGRANHAPFGGGGAPCKSSAGLGFAGGNGGRSAWSVPWPCGKWQRGGNTQAKHGSVDACTLCTEQRGWHRGLFSGLRGRVAQAKTRDAEARSSPLEGSMAQRAGGRSSTVRQGRTAWGGALAGPSFRIAPEGAACLPFRGDGAALALRAGLPGMGCSNPGRAGICVGHKGTSRMAFAGRGVPNTGCALPWRMFLQSFLIPAGGNGVGRAQNGCAWARRRPWARRSHALGGAASSPCSQRKSAWTTKAERAASLAFLLWRDQRGPWELAFFATWAGGLASVFTGPYRYGDWLAQAEG